MKFLRKHAEGSTEAAPDYWYAVIEGFGGTMWPTLFYSEHDAHEAAATLEGTVVLIAARVLEDEEGEYWPLPVRTPEIELAEAEQDVEEARQIFEATMRGRR